MAHGQSPKHERKARKKRAGASAPSRAKKTLVGDKASGSRAPAAGKADAGADRGSIRLQKLLAGAGFGSRREVEQFLIDERVTVNGRVARLGDRADPGVDDIRLDGERLMRDRPAYWILNKPRGVVTTVRDEAGRRTVIDLLPATVGRVFPVGRLDKETSGLLLLTNDGDTAYALLHPSLGNEREYRVNVKGQIDAPAIARLEKGVSLEEGRTAPAVVSDVRFDSDTGTSTLTLTLGEGRKRQIRRSLLVLGFPVRRLVRVRMGPLRIGRLTVGESRPLRSEERRALLAHVAWLKGEGGKPPQTGPSRRTRPTGPKTASKVRSRAESRADSEPRHSARKKSAGKKARRKKSAAKRPSRKKSGGRASVDAGHATAKPKTSSRRGQRTASSRNGARK